MELVLTDLDWSSCFVYLDNISLFTAAPLKNASLTDEIDRSAQQAETGRNELKPKKNILMPRESVTWTLRFHLLYS